MIIEVIILVSAEFLATFLMLIRKYILIIYVGPFLGTLIGNRTGINKANKLSLERINKYDGCLINKGVFYDFASLEERKKSVDKRKVKELLPYVEKLSNHVDEELLKDMYRNLSETKLKRKKKMLFSDLSGFYNPEKKIIEVNDKNSIGHEVLHMASSYYYKKKKESHCGFEQANDKAFIGRGLNEGYTELLASRIYNKDGKVETYKNEARIAKLFELFFDNPKDMEKYYFRHNLPGFIIYMQQFIPRKELIGMIITLDEINRLYSRGIITFTFKTAKLSMDLYKYFLRTNPSMKKRMAFEKILKESKLAELALNREKVSLQRNVIPFNSRDNEDVYHGHSRSRAA